MSLRGNIPANGAHRASQAKCVGPDQYSGIGTGFRERLRMNERGVASSVRRLDLDICFDHLNAKVRSGRLDGCGNARTHQKGCKVAPCDVSRMHVVCRLVFLVVFLIVSHGFSCNEFIALGHPTASSDWFRSRRSGHSRRPVRIPVRVVSCSGDVGLYQNPWFDPLPPALRTYRIRNDILRLGFIRDAEKSGSLEGWLFSEEHIKQSRQLSLLLCVTGVAGSVVGELCEIMCQDALGFLPRKIYRVSQRD